MGQVDVPPVFEQSSNASAVPSSSSLFVDDGRFHCPFNGCNRSFAELWRLKVHYRAPPDVRGSGKERGHGTELDVCPKCWSILKPGKHHVGCSSGKTTQRKRLRTSQSNLAVQTPPLPAGGDNALGGQLIMQQQQQQQQQWPPPVHQMWNQHAGVPIVKTDPQAADLIGSHPGYIGFQQPVQHLEVPVPMPGAHIGAWPPVGSVSTSLSVDPMWQQMGPSSLVPPHQQPPPAQQQAMAVPAAAADVFLGGVFADDEEFSYIPSIPSPPHLPDDFPGLPTGQAPMLFNFGQFSHRMPPKSEMQNHKLVAPLDKLMLSPDDQDMNSSGNVVATDDGDIMHLLFGVPDELPTMSTIHMHKWMSDVPAGTRPAQHHPLGLARTTSHAHTSPEAALLLNLPQPGGGDETGSGYSSIDQFQLKEESHVTERGTGFPQGWDLQNSGAQQEQKRLEQQQEPWSGMFHNNGSEMGATGQGWNAWQGHNETSLLLGSGNSLLNMKKDDEGDGTLGVGWDATVVS
eukprot:gene24981-10643_t